jgi:hypothetical protein
VAAPTGATSATPSPIANTVYLSHDVPFMILLRCLESMVACRASGDRAAPAPLRTRPPPRIRRQNDAVDTVPILTEPEVSQEDEHHDHDADDGEDVHVLPRFLLLFC